jgi:hypothetical protein
MDVFSSLIQNQKSVKRICQALGALGILLYLVGWFWPTSWWGTHSLAFLPPWQALALLATSLGLWLAWEKLPTFSGQVSQLAASSYTKWIPLLIASIYAVIFFAFPIIFDRYGDALYWHIFAEEVATEYESEWLELILSPHIFHTKTGQRTLLNTYSLFSYLSGWKIMWIIRILAALSGGLFVYLWLRMIRSYVTGHLNQIILALAGLSSGLMLNFFGHIEIYAPVFPAQLGLGMGLFAYLKRPDRRRLLVLLLLWVLNLKLHSSAILFGPVIGLVMLYHLIPGWELSQFNGKKMRYYVLYPLLTIGVIIYVFVLQDHQDSRMIYPGIDTTERLFLPVISPPPPLDWYVLHSFSHLFDYAQSWILSAGVALLVFVALWLVEGRKIHWNSPFLLLPGLACLLFFMFFFMINPLVGMPFDWDLFMLPAVPFMLLLLMLWSQVKPGNLGKWLLGPVLALWVLSQANLLVHQQAASLGAKYVHLGKYTYQSYWFRAAEDVDFGIELLKQVKSKEEVLEYLLFSVEGLEECAIEGNDREYGELIKDVGRHYLREMKDVDAALPYLKRARTFDPEHAPILVVLLEAHFVDGNFEAALAVAEDLIRLKQPTEARALRMGVHCALEAGLYERAVRHTAALLQLEPGNAMMAEILRRLQANEEVESLINFFKQGNE